MGKLTTHILDAAHGCPAENVTIRLYRLSGKNRELLKEITTNNDGRTDAPMLEGSNLTEGNYELEFEIGDYFRRKTELPATAFLDIIPIRFGVNDASEHYHVPLLASPYSYSTYRGS